MDPAVLREDMVDGLEHALQRPLGERVGVAMRTVPRHEFVGEAPYENRAGEQGGSRVLAPVTVARMLRALDASEGDSVLVVGAGVGYTAATLAELVGGRNVHAVDIDRRLVLDARRNLREAGYDSVLVDRRNGAGGLPEYAPFDRILVESAAVEPPRALIDQLAPGGRLAMPMGNAEQTLVAIERDESAPGGYAVAERHGPVQFRPMLIEGEQGGGPVRNRTEREDREFAQQGYFAPTGWEYDWVDWDEHL